VILYQLLAGTNPFLAEQPSGTLHRVMMEVPPRLCSLRDDVPPALDEALAKALEKAPDCRFSSAGEFAAALRAARAWSESEAVADLARVIQEDFSGPELSQLLGLDSLQSRDAAWRASQSGAALPLGSSRPPAAPPLQVEASSAGRTGDLTIRADLPAPLSTTVRPGRAPTAARQKRVLGLLATFAVVLGLGGAAFGLLRGKEQAQGPRFVLIEKQTDGVDLPSSAAIAAPNAQPSSGASAASAPAIQSATASHTTRLVSSGGSGATNATLPLNAAFQRQRGKIEACFSANPGDNEQLTLQFQVDATGAVRGVGLQPATVTSSPLGRCVLDVARTTLFPPGPGPISFSIPITVHKKLR